MALVRLLQTFNCTFAHSFAALPVNVEDNKDGTYDIVVSVPYSDELVPVTLDVGLSDSKHYGGQS